MNISQEQPDGRHAQGKLWGKGLELSCPSPQAPLSQNVHVFVDITEDTITALNTSGIPRVFGAVNQVLWRKTNYIFLVTHNITTIVIFIFSTLLQLVSSFPIHIVKAEMQTE